MLVTSVKTMAVLLAEAKMLGSHKPDDVKSLVLQYGRKLKLSL
jgi:hypothetical protein